MNNDELAAMIARNFYPADDDTRSFLATWSDHYDTLPDAINDDINDMLHNGNLDDLIDAPLIATDADYDAMLDRLLDDDLDLGTPITAILDARR